tara:strand:+ start:308 stop:484 length:177 start_codon:yes stop_codon:yes gene_type:complete
VVEAVVLTLQLQLQTKVKQEQVITHQLVLLKVIMVVLVVLNQDLQVLIHQEVEVEQVQ